jgi:hypothetical protein
MAEVRKNYLELIHLPLVSAGLLFTFSLIWPFLKIQSDNITFGFVVFSTISMLLFIIGLYVSTIINIKTKFLMIEKSKVQVGLVLLVFLSLSCRIIDRFYLRGDFNIWNIASFSLGRELRIALGSNIFSIFAALTYPICFIAFYKTRENLKKIVKVLIIIALIFITTDILFSGSRGTFLYLLIILIGFIRFGRLSLILCSILFMFAMAGFFFYRINIMLDIPITRSVAERLLSSGYADFVPAQNLEHISSDFLFYITVALTNILQYISHGYFEFAHIFSLENIFVKFHPNALLPQLNIFGFFMENFKSARDGMYYTLFGNLYLAFGIFSPLASFAAGVLMGFSLKRATFCGLGAIRLIQMMIFLSFFVNSLGGYDGILFLISIWIVSYIRIGLPRIKRNQLI